MLRLEDDGDRPLQSRHFRVSRTREESKRLNTLRGPAIVVSASGMANGGRIQHHLLHRLSDPATTVLFVGYQAEGTVGRRLLEGAPSVPLLGEEVPVKAAIRQITSFSAHADADELVAWVKSAPAPPRRIALNHGEPPALEALRARLVREVGCEVVVPDLDDEVIV
jgi:metallo-beta-lactamase family protein